MHIGHTEYGRCAPLKRDSRWIKALKPLGPLKKATLKFKKLLPSLRFHLWSPWSALCALTGHLQESPVLLSFKSCSATTVEKHHRSLAQHRGTAHVQHSVQLTRTTDQESSSQRYFGPVNVDSS